ncbi:transposase [Streptomyces sp. CA-249302]|uniref:transposase n=1 Tax=Streptomyces sp. CA-249302 TaxID=3240058 RepID=UPI003D91D8D3
MLGGEHPSDLTDEQWALVEVLLPSARAGPKGGRREKYPLRRIADAIFYVSRTSCAWRQPPKDFTPWPTAYWVVVHVVARRRNSRTHPRRTARPEP